MKDIVENFVKEKGAYVNSSIEIFDFHTTGRGFIAKNDYKRVAENVSFDFRPEVIVVYRETTEKQKKKRRCTKKAKKLNYPKSVQKMKDIVENFVKEKGAYVNSSIEIFDFHTTGRGFIAKKSINRGQMVLEIPKAAVITPNWIYNNAISCVSNIVVLNEDFKIDSTDLMIIWLVKEKQKGMQSPVRDYITSMPSLCTPLFNYRPRHLKLFPKQLRQKVENQKKELLARFEYLDKCFRRHGRGISFHEFQWAASMVLTRSIQAKGLTLCTELFEAPWFNNDSSHEIGLCPFFDLLNHSSENNCDWDFNPVTGSVWVEAVGDIKNSDQLYIDYDQGCDDYMLMNYGFCMETAANPKTALELSWSEIRKVIETKVTSDVCEVQKIFNRTKIDTEDASERLVFKIFHNRIPFKFSYIFEEIFNTV
ncbi:unnamed protein product [Oikopleura dioica]|uniref:SET domain-containing protein n=1 Tax=Oikopleura dioica TaxID=34765 RepID=E4X0N1_OIKDI|nr:unnamed protein product [Oikopleura dioica]